MFILNKKSLFLLNRALHRDIGYLSIGFTILFALSGLALNHRDDWNPNYSFVHKKEKIQIDKSFQDNDYIEKAKEVFHIQEKEKGAFWSSPNQLKIFFPHDTTVTLMKDQKTLFYESLKPRLFLRAFNGLHVNEVKSYWIVASDIYSIFLLYLALSAIFMIKGSKGIKGRGGILALVGLSVPLFFIWNFF